MQIGTGRGKYNQDIMNKKESIFKQKGKCTYMFCHFLVPTTLCSLEHTFS